MRRMIQATVVVLAAASAVAAAAYIIQAMDRYAWVSALGPLPWLAYAVGLCAVSVLGLALRSPACERLLWVTGGLMTGFVVLTGFSIGRAFVPAAGLLIVAALVGDIPSPLALLAHVPLAFACAVLQVTVPLFVLRH